MKNTLTATILLRLSACGYKPPEQAGLSSLKPYPSDTDICMRVAEDAEMTTLKQDNELFIACPRHEGGAISDRLAEGGRKSMIRGRWLLIAMPK